MRNFLHSKALFFIIAGLALLFIAYTFFYEKEDPNELYIAEQSFDPADIIVGRELLALLARMRVTKIDVSIFESDLFKALDDFSRPIPEQPVRRPNPFAPIGKDAVGTTTSIILPSSQAPSGTKPTGPSGAAAFPEIPSPDFFF